ncbi:Flp pilus assembly protein CpaB [Pajaroellobacter abortibovis]|uniref:Flp pilus assembly protein CpaB n=1 Tax=Pajaroellobacter abortibovis TaxID=1882918 RepID=A0A1L6MYJ7_9BACT|nr:Flp pilus assembly protein CpaB [Pajaroellobacter abortibovis]APS00527.1 Flp pilus assembly protein CpaB [Pajaroellobacter abortibovis]
MNKLALLTALIMSLLAGLLLFLYLRRFEQESSGGAPVKILVVIKPIDNHTMLTEDMIATRIIPQAYVESRAVREQERLRVLGLRVSNSLQANQVLMWTDLASTTDERRELSSLVQPGMRAVMVQLPSEDKSYLLIRPGDRLDVLATMRADQENRSVSTSVVLLQNILVLAVGADTGADLSGGGPTSSQKQERILSLSVNVPEAQLLELAQEKGKLSIALRSPNDVRIVEGLPDLNTSFLTDTKARSGIEAIRKTGRSGPIKLESVEVSP